MKSVAIRALADAADALARMARAMAEATETEPDPDALLPIRVAANAAATSVRVLRDAIRAHELPAYGRARDRSVRRGDLTAWIATRRVTPLPGIDDEDLARRVERLARERRRAALSECGGQRARWLS